jgi:hypothetical protein
LRSKRNRFNPGGSWSSEKRPVASSVSPGRFLHERIELLLRGVVQRRASVGEVDRREVAAPAASEELADQRERRRRGFDDEISDELPEDLSDPELRVVERALDGEIDVDDAVAILEQRDGQLHRQLGGRRALDPVSEFELVDEKAVLSGELAVLELVCNLHREPPARDRVAGVLPGVGRKRWQVDVVEAPLDVGESRGRERIDRACDFERGMVREAAPHVELRDRARPR